MVQGLAKLDILYTYLVVLSRFLAQHPLKLYVFSIEHILEQHFTAQLCAAG